MNDAEIFHAATENDGGRLAWERGKGTPVGDLYAAFAQQAEDLIASARRHVPGLPPIHFDFVHNKHVNAMAFKEHGRYFIGVTSGAISILQLIIHRILSDSQLLIHAGDPTKESSSLPLLANLIPNAHRMYESGVVPCVPQTFSRLQYSRHLINQATLFLIGHEIAHIVRGHVDYFLSKTGSHCFAEVVKDVDDPSAYLERQALEADADRRSFFSRLDTVLVNTTLHRHPAPPWLNDPIRTEQLLFDCAFSVNVLFRMFGDNSFSGSDLTDGQYPPFPIRRAFVMSFASEVIKNNWAQDLKEPAQKALEEATFGVERTFELITGKPSLLQGLTEAFGPEGRSHIQLLSNVWNGGLFERLQSFAYEKG